MTRIHTLYTRIIYAHKCRDIHAGFSTKGSDENRHVHTRTNTFLTHTHTQLYKQLHTHTHTHLHTYMYIHNCAHVVTHARTHTHTHTCTCMYTYSIAESCRLEKIITFFAQCSHGQNSISCPVLSTQCT